jgi:hypothetical protein
VHPRTDSPSLHSCPASDRASSFLLASALLVPPPNLAIRRRARREMRPIDFCHPCEKTACTRTSCVPGSLRPFRSVGASRTLGSARLDRGTRRFTSPRSASAGRAPTLLEPRVLSVAGGGSRAWALSSHGAGSTEPLTSLSPLPLLACAHTPSSVLGVTRSTLGLSAKRRLRVDQTRRKPPRPP